VQVRPVHGRADLNRFIAFPYRLHARDPLWVPPLRSDVRKLLDRAENPFFDHAEAEYFLAERGGKGVGFFGFFECEYDHAAADALFSAAEGWLRGKGHDVMRGPASFSTNDECGLLVRGFDTPPTLMMPHNPPYYPRLVEGGNFRKAKDLLVYRGGYQAMYLPVPERLARGTELLQKRLGVTIRALNLQDFQNEVVRIKQLYNRCWEQNWGFIPMTDREIDHLAVQFKPVVVPDLVPFAEKDGQPVGFGLVLPDLNQVFQRHRSGRLTPALLADLLLSLKLKRVRRARILLLGVIPELRGKGVDAMLYHWIWTHAAGHKIYWGEAGWILEDNPAMNAGLEKMEFTVYKTYRLYDRPI
jgi:GNAT superfamily N-acetyltransferase